MSTNAFLVDERDIHFTLFEHLNMEELFALDQYSEHDREMTESMISLTVDFCKDSLGALNRSGDKEGCSFDPETHKVIAPKGSQDAWNTFCENGFMGLSVPEEQGGIQTPQMLGVALGELFSGCNPAFMMYPGLSRTAAHLLRTYGASWMVDIVAGKILEGEWAGTMCLTEPAVGTAVGDLLTIAQRDGDSYKLKGTKQWVSGGEHDLADNIMQLVLARVEGAPVGIKGISLFLVPTKRFDITTGEITGPNDLKCIGIEHKMGLNGNSTCLLQLGDDDNCVGYLIGEENRGIEYMFLMMNEARIAVGVQAAGMASVAFLNAEAYAKDRIQGTRIESFKDANAERVAIVEHPDVRRMLLRQRAIVEGSRALCYQAGKHADLAHFAADETQRETSHNFLELLTPVVKAWCSDMGYDAALTAIQTYGGYGYTSDYPVEQIARDMKVCSIYEGTNGIQALDLVGRKMRMKGGMVFMSFLAELSDFAETHGEHEAIGKDVKLWAKSLEKLGETAMHIAGVGMSGDQGAAVLNAYPFLMAMGHVTVGQLLLEQAVVAHTALQGDVTDSDGVFYRNKIRTAQFFTHSILPEALAQMRVVASSDRSALDFEF